MFFPLIYGGQIYSMDMLDFDLNILDFLVRIRAAASPAMGSCTVGTNVGGAVGCAISVDGAAVSDVAG